MKMSRLSCSTKNAVNQWDDLKRHRQTDGFKVVFAIALLVLVLAARSNAGLTIHSTQNFSGTGYSALMEEFVLQGDQSKEVLLRGLDQSNFLDPETFLYNIDGSLLAFNNDWRDTQETEILATGLAPFNDLESAILSTLGPGTYAALLGFKNSTTGTDTIDLHDIEPDTSSIAAVGIRGLVVSSTIALTTTFTISTEAQTVLIRVLGPSLGSYGITPVVSDPTLELLDGNGGGLILSDNNWRDIQESAIEATGLAPFDDAESAILATLDPGDYTAVARGLSGGTGVAFVEVYAIPYDGALMNPAPVLPPTPTPTPSPTPIPTPARSLNISTRALVESGDNVMIGGFIITGTTEEVLIRAIGPSLGALGIAGALADPILELHGANGVLLASNDNWQDDPAQASEIEATGIPPVNNLESAIVATLSTGQYTGVVRGKGGTTGIGLVEVYDISQTDNSRLANISTRSVVEAGPNVAIGGFILGGSTGFSSIIVRAIGPSLSQVGISGALADPTLELHDGNGTLIGFDDNWQDDPTQAAQVSAAGLAPDNDLEAAIAVTLPPGAYTAIVAGKDGLSGVALVEVYNLE